VPRYQWRRELVIFKRRQVNADAGAKVLAAGFTLDARSGLLTASSGRFRLSAYVMGGTVRLGRSSSRPSGISFGYVPDSSSAMGEATSGAIYRL
jgi:hypothetical protein